VAAFAEDVAIRRYGEASANIVHWSDFDRAGHFAAMEVPDVLVGDVRECFRPCAERGQPLRKRLSPPLRSTHGTG
jgi:hypothetical protein